MEKLPIRVGMKVFHRCPVCGSMAFHKNKADQYIACDNGDWEISTNPENYGEEVRA